jgi:hypothetical protein
MFKFFFIKVALFLLTYTSLASDVIKNHKCLSPNNIYKNNHPLIGPFSLCQSKKDDKILFFKMRVTNTKNQLCFIPTHERKKKSFYIGEPRCLFVRIKEKMYKINFYKNRPGQYKHLKINGVLIFEDKFIQFPSPFSQNKKIGISEAYLKCISEMDKKKSNIKYCQSFKLKGEYIYLPL